MNNYSFQKVAKASLLLAISLFFLSACENSISYPFDGQTMGTSYHITVVSDKAIDKHPLDRMIKARLEAIEQSMSTYRESSEVSAFNRLEVGKAINVSSDFINVFNVAREVYTASNGAFDPSVGPLVVLWGFGPKLEVSHFEKTPDEKKLSEARALLNFSSIELSGKDLIKRKSVQLDFSAVAKGYAVDELAKLLKEQGIERYMVEVGGEVATSGKSPSGHRWKIGIEKPEAIDGPPVSVLRLNEAHVATSGDYRNYFEIDGVRYSHTIDPRTAKPINHKLSSVTVAADSVAKADAWATALSVLGEVEGINLAKEQGLQALFIYKTDKGFQITLTGNMQQYL